MMKALDLHGQARPEFTVHDHVSWFKEDAENMLIIFTNRSNLWGQRCSKITTFRQFLMFLGHTVGMELGFFPKVMQ